MKNIIFIILAIIGIGVIIWIISNSSTTPLQTEQFQVPEAKGYINDYAEIISSETEARLEAELSALGGYPSSIRYSHG